MAEQCSTVTLNPQPEHRLLKNERWDGCLEYSRFVLQERPVVFSLRVFPAEEDLGERLPLIHWNTTH